ncbi:MAG: GGDEF domain-containing protein [Polyangiales bacterium]
MLTSVIGGGLRDRLEARVFPLYYIPIAVAALMVSRTAGFALAALSSLFWVISIHLGGTTWSAGVFAFNTITQMISFGLIAFLVASIAHRYEVERQLGHTDSLTALPNSRSFYALAEVLIAGAHRRGRPFTIAYVDLDNFKHVNDTRGHLEGDQALRTAADVFRRAMRSSDVAARLGGDEFALLLPDTGPDQAKIALERFNEMVEDAMKENGWAITASIGALSFMEPPSSVEAAVHEADLVMYRAKQGGKNRVHLEVVETASVTSP